MPAGLQEQAAQQGIPGPMEAPGVLAMDLAPEVLVALVEAEVVQEVQVVL